MQLLTLPGQARGLAETVNIAEHGSAAGAASDEEGDVWVEDVPVQEQAAPQYDAQQVDCLTQSSCSCFCTDIAYLAQACLMAWGVLLCSL